jgi:biotin carboxyl carrier protein
MKLIAQIENADFDIEIKREGAMILAEIDGRQYELEATEPEPNTFLLKHQGKIYEAFVSTELNSDQVFKLKVGSEDFDVNLIDPKRLRGTIQARGIADGVAEIKTAMPGKVVRILVEENAEVCEGEGVIVVEAMKMQNEMKSPKDGIIKTHYFKEGETVNAGDILVVIE